MPLTIKSLFATLLFFAVPHISSSQAQVLILTVNGAPVTKYDVDQRQKIARLVENRQLSRQQAIDEVVDDRLKVQEGQRLGFKVTEAMVDDTFDRLAQSNGRTAFDFTKALRQSGIDAKALKGKYRADIAWDAVLRGAKSSSAGVSNAELSAALQQQDAAGGTIATDYDLQSIVFIVPRGSSAAYVQRRQQEARAARTRFGDCQSGFAALNGAQDVAIKSPISRSSTELSDGVLKIIQKTPIGGLSEPFATPEGIEAVAVCGKRERRDLLAARTKLDAELTSKRETQQSSAYLQDLRQRAQIAKR